MNNKHILDLTLRLSQALDQNYDVVNMDTVLSVIAALEGTTITKEQLEATRLAKYINQLRRRTKNDHLARRAKSLLKKWREMVGIQQQQQLNSDVMGAVTAAITNDNAMSGNNIHSHQHQHLQHRSQPTSPMTPLHMDALYHANTTAFTSATDVSPLTRSANLNVHNSNRRLELVEGQSGVHTTHAASSSAPPTVVPTVDGGKQPTSFANLLSGFCNDYHHSAGTAESSADTVNVAQSVSRNKSNKANAFNQRDVNNPTETFIIDQSSNSNSEVSAPAARPVKFAPIIIDIQDSNSGSNLIATNVNASASYTTTAAPTTPSKPLSSTSSATTVMGKSPSSVNTAVSINTITPSKSKRAKKEKKRKDRDNQNESNAGAQSLMVNLEESSSNLQQQQRQPPAATVETDEKCTPFIADEKSRLAYPRSNISEILSLSNSSMSSMFPLESASHDEHNKSNLSVNNNNRGSIMSTSTCDLTFAGKFKSQQGSALPLVTTNLNSYDLTGYNGSDIQRRTASPHMTAKSTAGAFAAQPSSVKFMRSDGGCNSNDSTSNSHASHPDDIDMPSTQANLLLLEANSRLKQDPPGHMNITQKATENVQLPVTLSTPVPAVSQVALESTTAATASGAAVMEKAAPRKRGRKKGSKGIDAVIAKELSLTPQMLMTSLGSGGKKVKTTKELYAEMQNRKLGIATNSSSPTLTNWPSQQQLTSRPASSCSEPSLQSPRTLDACSTNATMSTVATCSTPDKFLSNVHADDADTDSGTLTSEQSRDSAALQRGQVKRTISTDSNSNSQMPVSKSNEYKTATTAGEADDTKCFNSTTAIEAQLRELLKDLPAVPTIAQIEEECTADVVPCTCTIIEIMPEVPGGDAQSIGISENVAQIAPADEKASIKIEFNEQQLPISAVNVMPQPEQKPGGQVAAIKLEEPLRAPPPQNAAPAPAKPKKSIFDLDFDDDDDPLHTFKAEAAAASMKQEIDTTAAAMLPVTDDINDEIVKYNTKIMPAELSQEQSEKQVQQLLLPPEQQLAMQSAGAVSVPEVPMPIFPTYQVEEDPNCEAKQRFEIQTQRITKFHIEALHNCFIPNVNGNWDNANDISLTAKSNLDEATAIGDTVYTVMDGSNVVPKFGSLVTERIRKDLSHVSFTKNFKPKKRTAAMEKLYSIPFLGVARQVQTVSEKRSRHKHTSCHKIKTEVKTAATNLQLKHEENKTARPESGMNADAHADDKLISNAKTELLMESKTEKDIIAINKENVSQKDVDANNALYTYDLQTSKSASAVGTNNNIVLLKDITIDVTNTHDVSSMLLQHEGETDSELNGQNLLAIADNVNYANYALTNSAMPVATKEPSETVDKSAILGKGLDVVAQGKQQLNAANESESKELVTQNDSTLSELANENGVQMQTSAESAVPTPATAPTGATKVDDNNSSRSSSCSSSSLKQTQQSINLKLRRQFQDRKLLETNGGRKRKRKKHWQRHSYTESDDGGDSGDDGGGAAEDDDLKAKGCKKRTKRIKRIKIAINGDVATQMQFSMGSSNNSSDEYNEDSEDVDNDKQATDSNNDDVESSGGSRHSHYDYNIVNNDADISYAADYENDEPEPEDDEYADADLDEDCDEDYSGDFHEVVTRDLSAPSTGNNHIVLTIKKTPSKTNSPSNSLTAMSPVISTAASNSSAVANMRSPPVTAITLDDADDSLLADDCVIVIDDEVTSSDRDTPITPSAIVEPEVQIEIIGDETAEGKTLRKHIGCGSVSSVNSVVNFGDAFDDMSMTASQASKPKRRRKKRRRRALRRDEDSCNNSARKRKVHQELFFPHELCIKSGNRSKCILNISSCSSSCVDEDSDYEYYTSDGMKSQNSDLDDDVEPKTMNTESVAVAPVTAIKSLSVLNANGHKAAMDESKGDESRNTSMASSPCSTYCSSACNSPLATELERATEDNEEQDNPTAPLDAPNIENDISENVQSISSHMGYAENDGNDIKAAANDNEDADDGNALDKKAGSGDVIECDTDVELPLENNGLLHSFNNIYYRIEPNEPTIASKATNGLKNEFNENKGVANSDRLNYVEHKQQHQNIQLKQQQQLQLQLPNENCDDYNNLYNNNNNNFNLIKYASNTPSLENHVSCSFSCKQSDSCNSDDIEHQDTLGQQKLRTDITDITGNDGNGIVNVAQQDDIVANVNEKLRKLAGKQQQKDEAITATSTTAAILVPHKEYRTGLRAVDEDVDDEEGNNCARIQQFKEWHQVLQLRSYNDELLTVLPYVVLE